MIPIRHHIIVDNTIAPDNIVVEVREDGVNVGYRVDILIF